MSDTEDDAAGTIPRPTSRRSWRRSPRRSGCAGRRATCRPSSSASSTSSSWPIRRWPAGAATWATRCGWSTPPPSSTPWCPSSPSGRPVPSSRRACGRSSSGTSGWLTHQMSQSASAVSRALHIVDDRLQDLERQVEGQRVPGRRRRRVPRPSQRADAWWVEPAVAAVAKAPGRILHAACGDGWLVRRMVAAGGDAYGVDPRARVVDAAELGDARPARRARGGAPPRRGRGRPGCRRAERHGRRDGRRPSAASCSATIGTRLAPGRDAGRALGDPAGLGGARTRRPRPTWPPAGRCDPRPGAACWSRAGTRPSRTSGPGGADFLVTAVRAAITSPYAPAER